ncbi:MAG: NAD(P)/FAD-dependent oxidoreductase [FCB group bacterium]|nr:NAD(P)/FAD-dependent oxidoreductase [FCB group bacterium]
MRENINIIGAGLAGLTAAITLARNGFAVTVFEQHPDVGGRFNNDFQGLENWSSEIDVMEELTEMGLRLNFDYAPYSDGLILTPRGEVFTMRSDRTTFYLVSRGSTPETLDYGLKRQAEEYGVALKFGKRIDTYHGRVIVASGPKGADIIASGITFETDTPDIAAIVFDDSIAPKGYGYLLIRRGKGTIASVLFREFRKADHYRTMCIELFKNRLHLNITASRKFGGFGNFFLRKRQNRHNKLYVGEAAGFQDYLWGFGMRYAIRSGYLAAKSISEGFDYDTAWKRSLQPALETSLSNRYLFERLGQRGYHYLANRLRSREPRELLGRNYRPSLTKRLILGLAARKYTSRVKNRDCNHDDCSCVWCRCVQNGQFGVFKG